MLALNQILFHTSIKRVCQNTELNSYLQGQGHMQICYKFMSGSKYFTQMKTLAYSHIQMFVIESVDY